MTNKPSKEKHVWLEKAIETWLKNESMSREDLRIRFEGKISIPMIVAELKRRGLPTFAQRKRSLGR